MNERHVKFGPDTTLDKESYLSNPAGVTAHGRRFQQDDRQVVDIEHF
ncbi:MAG: hypothetical protein ETSY1_07560 [Candidatus Entotheonella factor]|uniref:Uncharacterized protein n=1 Tax=Entotheonella factor TaxID=1429438 RepID=W4LTN8_ENTF1|nr:MAG: hypothetical protein ETSY1_07560 [Candidatus Entotheonella factor]